MKIVKSVFSGKLFPALPILLILAAGTPVWSRGANEQDFRVDLEEILSEEGWSEEEIESLVTQDVEWDNFQKADPDVVALGLMYAAENSEKDEDFDLKPMEQAMMAVQLAERSMDMEQLGVGEMSMALSALEGVREILNEVKTFRSEGREITGREFGELITNKMKGRLTESGNSVAEKNRERAKKKIRDKVMENKNIPDNVDIPVDTDPGIPVNPGRP